MYKHRYQIAIINKRRMIFQNELFIFIIYNHRLITGLEKVYILPVERFKDG